MEKQGVHSFVIVMSTQNMRDAGRICGCARSPPAATVSAGLGAGRSTSPEAPSLKFAPSGPAS
jgi:hypothetical protein